MTKWTNIIRVIEQEIDECTISGSNEDEIFVEKDMIKQHLPASW